MRIKELEDVLKLVDELPPNKQMDAVRFLEWVVRDAGKSEAERVAETLRREGKWPPKL